METNNPTDIFFGDSPEAIEQQKVLEGQFGQSTRTEVQQSHHHVRAAEDENAAIKKKMFKEKSEGTELTTEQMEKYEELMEPKDGFVDILGNGQLKKKVLKPGVQGTRPSAGDMVSAKVKICLEDGTCVHDTSETFFMGEGDVIACIDMSVAMMDEGEQATIQSAARFGYGPNGRDPDIPADAPLTVEVEVLQVLPPPDLATVPEEDLLKFGEKKRERGNELFGAGDYSAAIGSYLGAVKFFEANGRELKGDGSLLLEIEDRRIKSYNNMAASQLKIGAHSAVISSCSMVLSAQPDNVKALYRMGKAFCARGEMEKAIGYLKQAIQLDPESKLLHREMSLWTQKRKREMQSEKNMYKKMMGDMANAPSKNKKSSGSSTMMKMSMIAGTIMVAMFAVGFSYYRATH